MDTNKLENLAKEFADDLKKIGSLDDLENLRIKYLGKKGKLAELFGEFAQISPEIKKEFGQKLNQLKGDIESKLAELRVDFSSKIATGGISQLEKTLPGKKPETGHLHLITTQAINEIVEIFKPLGFTQVRHPEVDWDFFAFEGLNMPKNHPARDEWETFFVKAPENKEYGKIVISPHTSSGQVHEMLKGQLPIRMLNISRCGRRQIDVNHLPFFFQFEGLVIDKNLSIAHLKGVLDYFAKKFFGSDRKTRLRPFHFQFTEPSFEVDISCGLCQGEGCRFCKEGWVELGGAGMVHPNVLKAGRIDPEIYNGFAFGWGVERTYMMKSGLKIDDMRYLAENNLKFLEQF